MSEASSGYRRRRRAFSGQPPMPKCDSNVIYLYAPRKSSMPALATTAIVHCSALPIRLAKLKELFSERDPLYAQVADWVVEG